MRVLQTPVRYPPDVGGVETHVRALSNALDESGHQVRVLCATDEASPNGVETDGGVDVRRLGTLTHVANTNVTPGLPMAGLRHVRWADVVHTHLPTPWSADLSALLGRLTGTPVVLTYHNDITGAGVAGAVAALYNRTGLPVTLRCADRILVTQSAYLDSSPHLSPYADKVETIPNGVDTTRFRPVAVPTARRRELGVDPDRPTLFFLSVLDEYHAYKGLDVLLDALARLARRRETPPQLVVGGDGPERATYERAVRNRGLDDHVTFAGRVPGDDLVELYAAADAFVLPSTSSRQEGFGLVLLEALACGTPVVATDVVGVAADVESADAGRIVEPGDPAALASGVVDVIAGDTAAMGERGRDLCVERYTWSDVAASVARVYAAVGAEE